MSATIVVRRIAATPVRSAAESWDVIASLLAAADSTARQELDGVGGIAASLIAAEAPRDSAIVVAGVGARLRIYCLYDEAAIVGDEVSEEALSWNPTDGDWAMSLPCHADDLSWVQEALARQSTRITARDLAEAVPSDLTDKDGATKSELGPVNVEAFLRP